MTIAVKRVLLAGALVALAGLAGCPSKQAASARPQPQATAPALPQPIAPAAASGQATPSATGGPISPAQSTMAPPAQTERDQELIQAVEKAYHAGLSDYQQGHLASARANFDYAVDLMLKCNCDLHKDTAVSEEFDHIVDAVNTLEMDALSHGNGLTPQTEAPAEVAGNITTPANPNVAAKAEAELKTTQSDLPLVMNEYVAAYIDFFENNPKGHGTIVASLERMGRYKAMIEQVLKEEGVPQDLIYQAFAESGFRPQAMNPRSGAGGMWQFMPYDTYGLSHNAWYDERFDPEKATHAYAREIKKDYDQLGDWYLAMAAYDWGAGNVQRAVERTGYADFWQLYKRNNLPQETKNYVPVFLAVTLMAKNPKQYGLEDIQPDPPLVTDTVRTNYAVDLRLVSDIVGAPVQEIAALNPSLLRMSTPPDEPFDLHLPAGTAAVFQKDIAEIPVDKRRAWRFHMIQDGDTLESVAHTWHVSPSELAFVNQLTTKSELSGVDSLVIPLSPERESGALRAVYHPRRGDTLVTIADRFGVTVQELRRWNNLRHNTIEPGRSLYVAEPARISMLHRGRRRHVSASPHASRSSAKLRARSTTKHKGSSRKAKKNTAHSTKKKPV
ncbi:MAG TPA: transglycosylase SLT domain-containing protein [Acidobacteriaceae bacterium]|jgi:membrane-bound lytic murein transglycosylase D|nr:transglycosylase SLT domain-containing protein [Acidobacteriaceae bacterium]